MVLSLELRSDSGITSPGDDKLRSVSYLRVIFDPQEADEPALQVEDVSSRPSWIWV